MAQTRLIQDLVELITPNNNDVFVVVDNTTNPSLSVTKKISYASLKEDLQDMINVLTSGGTGIDASYNDAGNVLTLSVVDDTTTQRTIISSGGTTIGTRQKLNFIKGSGISFVGTDNSGGNRVDLTVAVEPSEININDLNTSSPLAIALGGTNATTASGARANIGAAKAGTNSDITAISGLTSPLSVNQGGTGADTALQGLKNLAGLKYITSVSIAGESLVVNDTTLVSNEYRGELRGLKAGSAKVSVGIDGNDISIDANADDILNAASQNVDLNGFRVTNIATPVGSNDAATRAYVDQVAGGLTIKEAVIAATTTNLASTYSGGTLTVTGTGTPSIDAVSITATGTRVLVKDQTTATQNGIYTLTTPASSGVSAVFTRAVDFDSDAEVAAGTFTFVISGATNSDKQFAQTTNTPTLDTDPLIFTVLNDTTIADNTVTNAKLVDMAALTIKGAVNSGTPQDLTPNQAIGILNSGSTRLSASVLAIGSTVASGVVQLYDGIDSTSTSRAATAASAKTAYDAAVAASGVAVAASGVAANALPLSGGTMTGDIVFAPSQTFPSDAFPSGTAMLFVQTTAPVGWTKSTTHNDKALRIVSGTAGSGGSTAFTSVFTSRSVSLNGTVGSTTLTVAQIPSHSHSIPTSTANFGSSASGLCISWNHQNIFKYYERK